MPVSVNGTAYDLTGSKGAPAVVLIHGLGLDRIITWSQIIPALATRFRVLSYDLYGHGKSALPNEPVTLTTLAKQLIQLMDELHIRQAALIGFSLGGMINRRVAIDQPNRVSALVILNSPHKRGGEQQRQAEARLQENSSAGPAANVDATLRRWLTDQFRQDNADAVKAIRDVVLGNDPENYAAHRRVLVEGVKELIRPVPAIVHPTLVMTCENDSGSTPEMSHAIAREIPNAETHIVPELQHFGLIEAPEKFTGPILQFLMR